MVKSYYLHQYNGRPVHELVRDAENWAQAYVAGAKQSNVLLDATIKIEPMDWVNPDCTAATKAATAMAP